MPQPQAQPISTDDRANHFVPVGAQQNVGPEVAHLGVEGVGEDGGASRWCRQPGRRNPPRARSLQTRSGHSIGLHGTSLRNRSRAKRRITTQSGRFENWGVAAVQGTWVRSLVGAHREKKTDAAAALFFFDLQNFGLDCVDKVASPGSSSGVVCCTVGSDVGHGRDSWCLRAKQWRVF